MKKTMANDIETGSTLEEISGPAVGLGSRGSISLKDSLKNSSMENHERYSSPITLMKLFEQLKMQIEVTRSPGKRADIQKIGKAMEAALVRIAQNQKKMLMTQKKVAGAIKNELKIRGKYAKNIPEDDGMKDDFVEAVINELKGVGGISFEKFCRILNEITGFTEIGFGDYPGEETPPADRNVGTITLVIREGLSRELEKEA